MRTGDICTRQVVSTVAGSMLPEVAKLMRQAHVGCVVVVDDATRKPIGILTDRDIVLEVVAAGLDPRIITVGEIMTGNATVVAETDDITWSVKVMRDRGVRRLPVVDAAGALVGIVALDDLLESTATSLFDVVQAIGNERLLEGKRRKTPA